MDTKELVWEEKYSVGVLELDEQHKRLFTIINELLASINTNTTEERLGNIIESLIEYKKFHFATEEKYFKEFNYEGTEEHVKEHKEFDEKLEVLRKEYPKYTIEFAFKLVNFLEDWLVYHLMTADQKYKECFNSHGLK